MPNPKDVGLREQIVRIVADACAPITMQDVRLCAGEGKLEAHHAMQVVNIILAARARALSEKLKSILLPQER